RMSPILTRRARMPRRHSRRLARPVRPHRRVAGLLSPARMRYAPDSAVPVGRRSKALLGRKARSLADRAGRIEPGLDVEVGPLLFELPDALVVLVEHDVVVVAACVGAPVP